jgi:hypothetical protein
VSNRRKVSLSHLADVLASGLPVDPRLKPAPVRPQTAFPRVTTERIEELLDDTGEGRTITNAALVRVRFREGVPDPTMHYRGRPQAHTQATDGTPAA